MVVRSSLRLTLTMQYIKNIAILKMFSEVIKPMTIGARCRVRKVAENLYQLLCAKIAPKYLNQVLLLLQVLDNFYNYIN